MSIQTSSAGGFLLFRCKNYGRQVAYWHFASFRYAEIWSLSGHGGHRSSRADQARLVGTRPKRVVRGASLANTPGVQSWRLWACLLAFVAFRGVLAFRPNPLIWGNIHMSGWAFIAVSDGSDLVPRPHPPTRRCGLQLPLCLCGFA